MQPDERAEGAGCTRYGQKSVGQLDLVKEGRELLLRDDEDMVLSRDDSLKSKMADRLTDNKENYQLTRLKTAPLSQRNHCWLLCLHVSNGQLVIS